MLRKLRVLRGLGLMTKPRAPMTFALAITTVCGRIGWAEAARLVRRSTRRVRHWSDSDSAELPTLAQALALDAAYVQAGGDHAPILESYIRQLDVAMIDVVACRADLAQVIALASRETGDALGCCIQALQPGATPAEIYRAIAETEEADALFPRLIGRLKALLPGNGAAPKTTEGGTG